MSLSRKTSQTAVISAEHPPVNSRFPSPAQTPITKLPYLFISTDPHNDNTSLIHTSQQRRLPPTYLLTAQIPITATLQSTAQTPITLPLSRQDSPNRNTLRSTAQTPITLPLSRQDSLITTTPVNSTDSHHPSTQSTGLSHHHHPQSTAQAPITTPSSHPC